MTDQQAAAGAALGAVMGVGGAVGAAIGAAFAAEESLGKLMAGAAESSRKFEVNHENILQAGKVISGQVLVLQEAFEKAMEHLAIRGLQDNVNQAIAEAWNSRLADGEESYAGRVSQYLTSLTRLCDQLKSAAVQYGFTEDEVKTAMGAVGASS
ncbi:hypothetical protein Lesp02_54590 [Lentzea sp. NBRC 105346]|uniref:hypothetical protein n=1 Tax=Lentzea sp. NBRC 105346 TaxID=3032205 RepID=UPI0024A422E4|nr:hypothetical protein [Lentzea sp. NBRC 105346]GLZ33271.1 hypothetical protein Lesp02_54590 [Lentzea sp. NBRC 105346]